MSLQKNSNIASKLASMGEPTTALALEVVKPIVVEITKYLSRQASSKYSLYKNKKAADEHEFTNVMKSIEMVKTIWQSQKSVSLLEFYHPISIDIDNTPTQIDSYADFNTDDIVLISGTVGQGKSIYLRYLCLNEFTINKSIVIFIECRHLTHNVKIKEAIVNELKLYGFDTDNPSVVDMLFRSGKLFIALDGFDELKDRDIEPFLSALNYLKREYAQLRIVMTSRPGTDAFQNLFTQSFELNYIQDNELSTIINKLCSFNSDINVEDLLEQLHRSPHRVINLINTPLLVSLLLLIYNATEEIPQSFSEFYKELFLVLLKKHDSTKPGFKRDLRTGLSDSALQELFRTFCFISKQRDSLSFEHREVIDLFKESIDASEYNTSPDNLFYDITMGTNLIIQDGLKYTFIHRSIQEFFTAEFILSLPIEKLMEFSKIIVNNISYWNEEVFFIQDVDKYKYLKYFLIPAYENLFSQIGFKDVLKDDIKTILDKYISHEVTVLVEMRHGSIVETSFGWNIKGWMTDPFTFELTNSLSKHTDNISDNEKLLADINPKRDESYSQYLINAKDALETLNTYDHLLEELATSLGVFIRKYKEDLEIIKVKDEKLGSLLGIY